MSTQKRRLFLAIPIAAGIALTGLVLALAFKFSAGPEGPPLASADIRPGEPFALRFYSNGRDVRVWLDLECDECSFPVTGEMRLSSERETIDTATIGAGSSKNRGWSGAHRTIKERLVFDADAQKRGKEMTLSGTLAVHGARTFFTHEVRKDAPAPRVRLLRLTVTN